MTKKRQTRRSISVTAQGYLTAEQIAKSTKESVSGLLERLLIEESARKDVDVPTRDEALGLQPPKPRPPGDITGGGIFTF